MTRYIAYGRGISDGMVGIPGDSIEEAGLRFTEQFGHDPMFIFTEYEMDLARQRKNAAYAKFRGEE